MPNKKYTYSRRAECDLIQIFKDTAKQWGVNQANKYADGLENMIDLLSENPELGRKCDEIKTGYQRFEYERHVIFYRKRKNDIFIIRHIHDRMDVSRHL